MKTTFRMGARGGGLVGSFDPDQPRDDYGRWTATVDHAYEGESEHTFEGNRSEIPAHVNEIAGRAPGGAGYVSRVYVTNEETGEDVYRYSSRNGGEFIDQQAENSQTSSAEARPTRATRPPLPPRERLRFIRADERRVIAAPQRAESTPMTERLLETLTTTLAALASKPAQPLTLQVAPSTVELVMPEQPPAHVEVHVPERSVEVNVPEQQAPVVNITNEIPEQAPPNVLVAPADVTVQAPPAPVVEVNLPAPVVNVTNDVQVDVPRPRPVRVEKDSDGTVRYIPEPE